MIRQCELSEVLICRYVFCKSAHQSKDGLGGDLETSFIQRWSFLLMDSENLWKVEN